MIILPIYLDDTDTGCILPLIDYVDAGEVQGFGDPPGVDDLPSHHEGSETGLVDARLSVGLFGMAGLKASADWKTRSWEWIGFGSRSSTGSGTGYNVQWGFGLRLHIQSSAADFDSTVDAQAIAFKTRLSGLQTSFAAESFGVSGVELYGALPTPDAYDANALVTFRKVAAAAVAAAIDKKTVRPLPIGVTFDGDIATLAVRKALAVRLAARLIKEGKDQETLRARAGAAELPVAEVDRVWKAWAGSRDDRRLLADRWLYTSGNFLDHPATQDEIDGRVRKEPLSTQAVGGTSKAVDVDRTIVRSQLMDIKTAAAAGYGPASGSFSGDVRRLVYEVFRRTGAIDVKVENGVARVLTPVSGLVRLNCLQADVANSLKGSFSGVAADAALHHKTAEFAFTGHGYSSKVDALQLTQHTDSWNAADRLAVVAEAFKLLADPENHVPKPLPDGLVLQCGTEHNARGFPGARAISRTLDALAAGDSQPEARKALEDIALDPAAADALYDIYDRSDAVNFLKKVKS